MKRFAAQYSFFAAVFFILAGCVTGVPEADVAELYFKLGKAYFDLGEYNNAVNAYTQALEFDSELVKAGYNLAHVYLETGRISEARKLLLDLLQDDEENSVLLSTLAWANYLEGDLEEALRLYLEVSDRLEGDVDALFNTATLLWETGRYSEALERFLELYELDPSLDHVPSIAELYVLNNEPETAILYLELYVAGNEKSVSERVDLAGLYREVREYGKAVAMYTEAIDKSEVPIPEAVFARGAILLAYIEDTDRGFADIRAAFQNGFTDRTAVADLQAQLASEYQAEYSALRAEFGLEEDAPAEGDTDEGSEVGSDL